MVWASEGRIVAFLGSSSVVAQRFVPSGRAWARYRYGSIVAFFFIGPMLNAHFKRRRGVEGDIRSTSSSSRLLSPFWL